MKALWLDPLRQVNVQITATIAPVFPDRASGKGSFAIQILLDSPHDSPDRFPSSLCLRPMEMRHLIKCLSEMCDQAEARDNARLLAAK